MRVSNMISSRGNQVPNQFEIYTRKGRYFQSYQTTIAFVNKKGQVFLDTEAWTYSETTGRYRNIFLGEKIAETRARIKSGEYKLKNLNYPYRLHY